MKKYWILSLLLILTAVILAPAAAASDLSLSGTSSVVAGNDFVLSISGGDLLGTVTLSLESGNRPDLKLLAGQPDVSGSATSATVKLDSSGRARVQYTTESGGDPATLRFKVSDGSSSDTTSVSVTRGTVSATTVSTPRPTSSSGGYAIGSTVDLSGAAPGTNKVYLFMIGPNLPSGGAKLSNPSVAAVTGDPDTFVSRSVSDGRWSYKWQTSGRLDAGTYTIFVVDRPANRYSLQDASYSTFTVTLGRPSMTAGVSGGTSGTAVPTTISTTVPTTEVPTATPTPEPVPEPSIWDQIVAWFNSLFRASAAEPISCVMEKETVTLSGTTTFSTEKELLVSIEPYFTAMPKGSYQEFVGWSAVIPVVSGDKGVNVWSATAEVPTGKYLVTIEPIGGGQTISYEITVA